MSSHPRGPELAMMMFGCVVSLWSFAMVALYSSLNTTIFFSCQFLSKQTLLEQFLSRFTPYSFFRPHLSPIPPPPSTPHPPRPPSLPLPPKSFHFWRSRGEKVSFPSLPRPWLQKASSNYVILEECSNKHDFFFTSLFWWPFQIWHYLVLD